MPIRNSLQRLRYQMFERIARLTWMRIIKAHNVNANLNEDGITADIIVEILLFCKKHELPIGLYAIRSRNEPTYGNDLDIFVEVAAGQYIWFALQAKLLKTDNTYDSLVKSKPQWNNLAKLKTKTDCIPFYLLYNGKKAFYKKKLVDSCGKRFSGHQFGCSIVEPAYVEKQVLAGNNSFEDFHEIPAQPWRILMDCALSTHSSTKTYSLANIENAVDRKTYTILVSSGIKMEINYETPNLDNPIVKVFRDIGRVAEYILVLPLSKL